MTFTEKREYSVILGDYLISKGFEYEGSRIKDCSTKGITLTCACRKIEAVSNPCKFVICPTCLEKRRSIFRRRYLPVVNSFKIPKSYTAKGIRLLTLSLPNEKDLGLGIKRLKESFKRFRSRKYVKERVYGHISVVEFHRGNDGLWNIHIHSLVYSRFLNMIVPPEGSKAYFETGGDARLVYEWKQASRSNDAYVFVSKPREGYTSRGALNYILKYIGKGGFDFDNLEDSLEIFLSIRGQRLVINGGCMVITRRVVIRKNLDVIRCPDCGLPFSYGECEEYLLNVGLDPPPFFGRRRQVL